MDIFAVHALAGIVGVIMTGLYVVQIDILESLDT
jgi:ammonia channel protein AmtB